MTSSLRRLLFVLLMAAGWSGAVNAQTETPGIDALVSQFLNSNGMTVPEPMPANPVAYDNFDATQPAQIDLSGLEIMATSQIRIAPDSLPFTAELLDQTLGADGLAVLDDMAADGSLYGLGNLIAEPVTTRSFWGTDTPDRPLFEGVSILDELNRALADVSTPELREKAERLAKELERLTGAGAVYDELFGPGGAATCGRDAVVFLTDGEHIVRCLGPAESTAFANGFDAHSMAFSDLALAVSNNFEVELVIGIAKPEYPIYNGQFAGDFFNDTNHNFILRYDQATSSFLPVHLMWDGASWSEAPSDARFVLSNTSMTVLIPRSGSDPTAVRYNTFGGVFQGQGGVGSYSVPNPGEAPMPFAPSLPSVAAGFVPPTAATDFLNPAVFEARQATTSTTTTTTSTTSTTSTTEGAGRAETTASTESGSEASDGETSDGETSGRATDDGSADDGSATDGSANDGSTDDGDGDGVKPLGVGLLGLGVIGAAIGGYLLLAGNNDPCEAERRAYAAAKQACEEARVEALRERQAADDASIDIERIGEDLDDLAQEWPPAGWSGEGDGTSIEFTDAAGGGTDRWTNHVGREWRKYQLDRWREGEISGEDATRIGNEIPSGEFLAEIAEIDADYAALRDELEAELATALAANPDAAQAAADALAAEQHAEAACAAAKHAKAALDACEDKVTQPEPQTEPEPGPGPQGPGALPTRPGSTAPPLTGPTSTQPRDGSPCQVGDAPPPPIVVDTFDKTLVVDFTLRVQPVGYRQGDEAQTVALGLGQAAAYVDALAAAASGAGAIRKVGAGQVGGAGVSVAGVAAGVPTSPVDVALSIVRMTAQLGSIVATSVGRWLNEHHEIYTVHSVMYEQHVAAMWRDEFECVDGSWRKQRVFEYSIGKLTKRSVPDEEVLYDELEHETKGRLRMMRNTARNDANSFGAFAQSGGGR